MSIGLSSKRIAGKAHEKVDDMTSQLSGNPFRNAYAASAWVPDVAATNAPRRQTAAGTFGDFGPFRLSEPLLPLEPFDP